jgi:hypothetical protein
MPLEGAAVRASAAEAPPPASLSRFQAEGVAIEFTTPVLSSARVRPSDTDKLEVIISDLGGGRGQYVVPLRHLNKVVTLTVHDRTLCEEVMHRNAISPDEIRRAVLTVAKMGLAGQQAAKSARQAIEDEQKERLLTTVCLIHRAIAQGGSEQAVPSLNALASGVNRGQMKQLLAKVARSAGLTPDAIYGVLEEWGGIVGAVGVPAMPLECRLRRLGSQVFDFGSQLRQWAEEEISHIGDGARLVATQADRIGAAAEREVAAVDAFTNRMHEVVPTWQTAREELRAAVAKLAWTMNGWEANLRRWRAAAQTSHEDQLRVVAAIRATMPQEAEQMIPDGWNDDDGGARRGTRKVQAHQDWKTGQIDFDVVRRLEGLKQHAL